MRVTVQDVIDRILAEVPDRVDETVDTIKCGSPDAEVRGIATTFIATVDVIRRAAEAGANFIITHEPTYYGHRDETDWLEGDAVMEGKRALLAELDLTVWRFHDHWHRHRPDGIVTGVARALGWQDRKDPDNPITFTIPEKTLRELAAHVKARLGGNANRVTGDPEMACRRVALMPGAPATTAHVDVLRRDDVDVVLVGEGQEWIACEWVRDAVALGHRKALIYGGHCNTEEGGMDYLVDWLQPKFAEIPITFVPAGDPFWAV